MSFLATDSCRLHYQLLDNAGSGGPCQIFLHGMVMDNLSSWFFTLANQASQLGPVLLYDLRGHGLSSRPKGGYGISDHVQDLRRLVEAVAGSPVVLTGNSYGGLLALNFAVAYPELVSGLILVDAQLNDAAWRDGMLASLSLKGEGREQMIAREFQHWLGRSSPRKSQRLAETAGDLIYGTSLLEDLRSSDLVTDAELRHINIPCLAIYGGESNLLPAARRLERLMPDCSLEVLPGCSHSVLWEETARVRALILGRLAAFSDGASQANDDAPMSEVV